MNERHNKTSDIIVPKKPTTMSKSHWQSQNIFKQLKEGPIQSDLAPAFSQLGPMKNIFGFIFQYHMKIYFPSKKNVSWNRKDWAKKPTRIWKRRWAERVKWRRWRRPTSVDAGRLPPPAAPTSPPQSPPNSFHQLSRFALVQCVWLTGSTRLNCWFDLSFSC